MCSLQLYTGRRSQLMEDIENTSKSEQNNQKNQPGQVDEPKEQLNNENEEGRNQVSKQEYENMQKEVEKKEIQQEGEYDRREEEQQGNQINDFDKFEDYHEQSQASEVNNNKVVKEQDKQERVQVQEKKLLDQSKINQEVVEKPAEEKVQLQSQEPKSIQNPKENENSLQAQNKDIPEQSNPKSPKIQKTNSQEIVEQSQNKKQQPDNQTNIQKSKINNLSGSIILRQAQKQRIGSIFQHFRKFNRQYEQITSSYKLIIKNVMSQLKSKVAYKSNLQNTLIEYFQTYSKIHKEFDQKVFKLGKITKQENTGTSNKYLNMRQYLKQGFEEFSQLRKNIGMNNQKLDGFINTYVISSISKVFEDYRNEIVAEEKRQVTQKEDFTKEEKSFKKVIQNLDKLCKKSIEGGKTNQDIFMQLTNYINREKEFRKVLIRYGKTVIQLRKNYVSLQTKLFEKLQKILNQFKNQQKMVYVAAKQFTFIQDFANFAQENAKYQNLCTITDVDYIKGVLKLQNRKERATFENHHFEQYLQMPFIDPFIAQAKKLLKGAIKKSFPLRKANTELVHTISQNLIEYNKELNECQQKIVIRHVNANIIGEGAVQFSQMVKKVIFTDHRTIRMQLESADRAQELISYLNEMQLIGKN